MNVNSTNVALMSLSNNSTVTFLTTTSFTNASSLTNDTDSTSRTIPGPGALSGKAILALGKATLHGAEVLIIRRRIQVISSKFPHKDEDNIRGIDRMYKDILELSRRDLYSDVIRTQALNVILAQIGSGHVEKLVQCLASWHDVELLLLLSELIEMFDPLRLAKDAKTGNLPSSIKAYQYFLADFHRDGLGPFVSFLGHLILASEQATRVVFEAGVIKFLVHAYISGFSDPLVAKAGVVNTQLRIVCDSLVDAISKSKKGRILFVKDKFHVLWPMRPGSLLFEKIPDRRARRAEVWRSADAEIIALRIQSILNMMTLEGHHGLLDQDSLDDIASDILELSRDGAHHEAVTSFMLNMSLILIGSRRIKELVYCVSSWPVTDIQLFLSKLTFMFNPLRLSVAKTEGNLPNLIQTYHQSCVDTKIDHSLEPIITFIHRLAQVSDRVSNAILGSGTLEFFTHFYIGNFFDPLGNDMFHGSPILRAACDSVLRTCSSTLSGLKIISDHQLYALWPTSVLPTFPFARLVDRSNQRAKVWKEMGAEVASLRMQSIFNMMVTGDRWGLPELDTLDNIAADMLDFFRSPNYQSSLKTRVIDMMLLLVGRGRTEKLIDCLVAWPFAEMKMFIIELMKMFDPLWAMQASLGLRKARQGSLNVERNCSLESIVIFLERLAQHCESASQAILEGGILDFLLHIYLADFCDPLANNVNVGRSNLRAACDSLLRALKAEQLGSTLIREHNLCALWPSTPNSQLIFTTKSDRVVRRAETLRSMDPECILLRLGLILRGLTLCMSPTRKGQEYHPEIHPFDDIVTDALECLGYAHQYPDGIKASARCILLTLLASGRDETLVSSLDIWRPSRIIRLITELVETFVSRELRTLPARGETEVSISVQIYYKFLTGPKSHPMEPLFAFCDRIVQRCPVIQMGSFWNFDVFCLLKRYLPHLRNALLAGPEDDTIFQEWCDSISIAYSRSKTIDPNRQRGVQRFYGLGGSEIVE